jgi:Fur family ferric uptake transcriptional regulator
MIDLKKICQDKGLRMTDQRSIIADIITELGGHPAGHPDVNLIYMKASEKDSNISIATVYRTVKLFEEYGVIEKHDFKDGRSRYEPIQESNHHDHLIDIESGDVYEFSNSEIEIIQKRIAEELGFELVDHRLELYGKKINK